MKNTMPPIVVACLIALSGCSMYGATPSGPRDVAIGECSPTPCVKVVLSAPPIVSESLDAKAKESIEREMSRMLYASIDVDNSDPSADTLVQEVRERFDEYKSLSDASIDWRLERKASLIFENQDVVTCEVTSEGYLGGAHGFHDRTLLTFDAKTGTRLGITDMIDDSSRGVLVKIAEREFRRARDIRAEQSLQEAGFFILPGQEMPLSENIALTPKGLEIHYNPYEVGPYAMGDTRVTIPQEAIEPLLKAELRSVFAVPAQESHGK